MALVSTDINITASDLGSGGDESFTASTTPAITPHNGKTNAFLVSGDFAGGTVTLQHKIGDTYVDIGPDTTLTANGGGLFTSPVSDIRVDVTGADGSPAFDVQVIIKPINL
jgi:hypothetical protein